MRKNLTQKTKEINRVFHEVEAETYDQRHPEILWEKKRWQSFGQEYVAGFFKKPVTILDVGTGTGFVPSILATHLNHKDRVICTDISRRMLKLAENKLKKFSCQLDFKEVDNESMDFLEESSVDVITANSVLHHLPSYENFLKEADRILKPGGIICIMHEPNKRFAQNDFLTFSFRLLGFLKNKLAKKRSSTKQDLSERINKRLVQEGVIEAGEELSAQELQSLVDVWSPTARRKIDIRKGFDPWLLTEKYFSGYQKLFIKTYNHLGKIDPRANLLFRFLNGVFSVIWPKSGSSFSLALKK